LLDAYARWAVLRRVRRDSHGKPVTDGAAAWARHRILIARRFLLWIDDRGTTLTHLSQPDIDTWLTDTAASSGYDIETFIDWLDQRRLLTHELDVPTRRRRTGLNPLDYDAHVKQLQRCLTDTDLPEQSLPGPAHHKTSATRAA
jgi:hypothetical protein